MAERRAHPALFVLALAALLTSTMVLALGDGEPIPTQPDGPPVLAPSSARSHDAGTHTGAARAPGGEDLPAGRFVPPALSGGRRAVAAAARRFLAAFLRYEVGDARPPGLVALRATSTEAFVAQLLLAPPRPAAAGLPRRARLAGIEITLPSDAAPRALVSGALRRQGSVEGFAFLFERHGQRWLASGVGE
jgi:hypothetical protein